MEESEKPDQPPLLWVGIAYNLKKQAASDIPDSEAEYDDFDTIRTIQNVLESNRCKVELFEADDDFPARLAPKKVDIVFNIAEGKSGRAREAQIPAILDFFHIPFTGSDETTLCIALDKALTKRILSSYHILTPQYAVLRRETHRLAGRVVYPSIVKPNAEGSSKGISNLSYVSNIDELKGLASKEIDLYQEDMLIEEYIGGREFTVGVLGNGGNTHVFPPMEIVYKNQEKRFNIYSYEVKKHYADYIRYECPAKIPDKIEAEMVKTAKKIYQILGCLDFARIDFRLSPEGRIYFIEINPLPGLAPGYSDFPMIASFNGMDYASLIRSILDCALKRYGLNLCL